MLRRPTFGATLPAPDEDSLAHSRRVAERIRRAIKQAGGSLSFAEFMQLALYAPGLGYYNAGARKFGPGGDFTTAPETSPLFGRVLARQCASVLKALPSRKVLELGAGSGTLAAEITQSLPAYGIESCDYAILEVSPELRKRQVELLRGQTPAHAGKVTWLDELPESFCGVVIANEVADALPVERFERTGAGVLQHRVIDQGGGFGWRRDPAPPFLVEAVLHLEDTLGAKLPAGYVSELSAGLPAWIGEISSCVEQGFVFLSDYGVTRREYYSEDRNGGWLRCHFRHRAHGNPLIYPGIQDLSAWVDFTAVAEGATAAGMEIAGFVTQSQFLLHGGLESEMAEFDRLPTAAQLELSRQVKLLTLPGEMGEHFKCIGLSKNQAMTPGAFDTYDRSHTL
jgi:SAM-dependent MidA family methyltransferase